jgi:hypothetical protein
LWQAAVLHDRLIHLDGVVLKIEKHAAEANAIGLIAAL